MAAPRVSIVTPVYNARVFLRPAVESVLMQSTHDFELFLIDDASTDGSREWLRTIGDPRVRLLENQYNVGPALTRNRALALAKGEFIAFHNADDLAVPDRLAKQVTFLDAHPEIQLLGGSLTVRNSDTARESLWSAPRAHLDILWHGMLDCPMRISTLMVRRAAVERHQLNFNPAFPVHADYEWVMRAVRVATAANLPEPLAIAVRHPGSLTVRKSAALQAAANRIAFASIRAELPDFPIDAVAVAELRTVLAGAPGEARTLERTSRMMDVRIALLNAFRRKHPPERAEGVSEFMS
jgi:glycosyltransferase involved in cell wall biosynthesis